MQQGFTAMVTLMICTALLVGMLVLSGTERAHAASGAEINVRVEEALARFRDEVDGADAVLSRARGILVFPRVWQGGIGLGGEYGEGALLVNNRVVDYYNIVSVSYGFQLGGQKKTVLIAFMDDSALHEFRNSKGWQIGADASVALIKIGAEGELEATEINEPIIGFVYGQKGLMYNLSLEGSKITKLDK